MAASEISMSTLKSRQTTPINWAKKTGGETLGDILLSSFLNNDPSASRETLKVKRKEQLDADFHRNIYAAFDIDELNNIKKVMISDDRNPIFCQADLRGNGCSFQYHNFLAAMHNDGNAVAKIESSKISFCYLDDFKNVCTFSIHYRSSINEDDKQGWVIDIATDINEPVDTRKLTIFQEKTLDPELGIDKTNMVEFHQQLSQVINRDEIYNLVKVLIINGKLNTKYLHFLKERLKVNEILDENLQNVMIEAKEINLNINIKEIRHELNKGSDFFYKVIENTIENKSENPKDNQEYIDFARKINNEIQLLTNKITQIQTINVENDATYYLQAIKKIRASALAINPHNFKDSQELRTELLNFNPQSLINRVEQIYSQSPRLIVESMSESCPDNKDVSSLMEKIVNRFINWKLSDERANDSSLFFKSTEYEYLYVELLETKFLSKENLDTIIKIISEDLTKGDVEHYNRVKNLPQVNSSFKPYYAKAEKIFYSNYLDEMNQEMSLEIACATQTKDLALKSYLAMAFGGATLLGVTFFTGGLATIGAGTMYMGTGAAIGSTAITAGVVKSADGKGHAISKQLEYLATMDQQIETQIDKACSEMLLGIETKLDTHQSKLSSKQESTAPNQATSFRFFPAVTAFAPVEKTLLETPNIGCG